MTTICVTGTPGTGKTTVAKQLAKVLGFEYFDVNTILDSHTTGFDKQRNCKIIDTDSLIEELESLAEDKDVVVDSHLSHFMRGISLCVITRCDLFTLKQRLSLRDYSEDKVQENLQSEIMDVIIGEVEELGINHIIVDTTEPINYEELKNNIKKLL